MAYHCPNCGSEISFGESICPSCKSNVTDVWEQTPQQKSSQPKVTPGMGTVDSNNGSPFPPPTNNSGTPFPPPKSDAGSPFPPAKSNAPGSPFPSTPAKPSNSPFPPAKSSGEASPFPPSSAASPFPPAQSNSTPFPPSSASQPFPPIAPETPSIASIAYLDIPSIGATIKIPSNVDKLRIGRDDIQGAATKSLPDLNAYKNISRKRENSEHFIIHVDNDQFKIEDVHSTNGTYLGTTKLGQGVPPQPLKDGDKIIVPIEEFGKMVQLEIFFKKS